MHNYSTRADTKKKQSISTLLETNERVDNCKWRLDWNVFGFFCLFFKIIAMSNHRSSSRIHVLFEDNLIDFNLTPTIKSGHEWLVLCARRETKLAVSSEKRKAKWVQLKKKCLQCSWNLLKTSPAMSAVLTSCACLYQATGRSSAPSVASPSPRRETCCDTSSCTPAKNPSNAPSAATPAGGVMPSPAICALMLVRLLLTLFSFLLIHFCYPEETCLSSEALQRSGGIGDPWHWRIYFQMRLSSIFWTDPCVKFDILFLPILCFCLHVHTLSCCECVYLIIAVCLSHNIEKKYKKRF